MDRYILSQPLPPQLATEPAASDTATWADLWRSIQQKPWGALCTSTWKGSLYRASSLWVFRIKAQPGRWGASCTVSFLGLGQETRQSPEGTLIRSRKQDRELAYKPPLQRARNLLKPETLPAAFAFPDRPHAHLHRSQHNASAGSSRSPSKPAPSFLPVHIPHFTLGSRPTSSTKPFR